MNIDDFVIRYATNKDAEQVLSLYRTQIGREFCPWDESYPSMEEIEYDLSRDSLFVGVIDGKIVSSITLDKDENVECLKCWSDSLYPGGEVSRVAVHPDYQNFGIARKMMEYAMDELKRRGKRSVHLLVNVLNTKALRSYAKFDFSVVGECDLFDQHFFCYEKEL